MLSAIFFDFCERPFGIELSLLTTSFRLIIDTGIGIAYV